MAVNASMPSPIPWLVYLLRRRDGSLHTEAVGVSAIKARHLGQYHGAGVFTGRGLRFRHFAQRYRLPLTAVFGLSLLPVRGILLGIGSRRLTGPHSRHGDTGQGYGPER